MSTILISGANRGIGFELARQFAADGWTVLGTARDPSSAGELDAILGMTVLPLDVTQSSSIEALCDAAEPSPGRSLPKVRSSPSPTSTGKPSTEQSMTSSLPAARRCRFAMHWPEAVMARHCLQRRVLTIAATRSSRSAPLRSPSIHPAPSASSAVTRKTSVMAQRRPVAESGVILVTTVLIGADQHSNRCHSLLLRAARRATAVARKFLGPLQSGAGGSALPKIQAAYAARKSWSMPD